MERLSRVERIITALWPHTVKVGSIYTGTDQDLVISNTKTRFLY